MSLNKLSGEQIEQADTTKLGVVQMATDAEVATGTETTKPISVKQLTDTKDAINAAKQDNLTTAQLAAANSGIDSTKVAQIEANKEDIAEIEADLYGWQKPADWIDIRSGALPNSVYFLVGHSADYTSYNEFVINAEVSNSGTYDVFVDGIKNASAVASGTATTLNWQTLALTSGFDVTYPSALRTHIVRITPTSNSNSFSRITSGAATTRDQGTLWVHSTSSQKMNIYYLMFGGNNYRHPLCEAFTTDQETFKTNWPEYAFAYTNLKTAPVIELTHQGGINGIFEGTKIKKAVFKNAQGNSGSGVGFSAYTEQWECMGGAIRPSWSLFAEMANLKQIKGSFSFANSNNCSNLFYKTTNVQNPLFLDASEGTKVTVLGFGGSSSYPVRFVKGLVVSPSAPFSDSSPQLDVSYSGMDRAALVNLFKSMPYNVGYSVVGSPTITDGVVSGFSQTDYLQLPQITRSYNSNMEFFVRFKTPEVMSESNMAIITYLGRFYTPVLWVWRGAVFCQPFEDTLFGTGQVVANTWYRVRFAGNNGTWTLTVYDDNGVVLGERSETYASGSSLTNTLQIANYYNDSYPVAAVDLNNTYINLNGVPWFTGKASMTKTCSIVGCTGTADLTAEDKAIVTNKGWELTVA